MATKNNETQTEKRTRTTYPLAEVCERILSSGISYEDALYFNGANEKVIRNAFNLIGKLSNVKVEAEEDVPMRQVVNA